MVETTIVLSVFDYTLKIPVAVRKHDNTGVVLAFQMKYFHVTCVSYYSYGHISNYGTYGYHLTFSPQHTEVQGDIAITLLSH